MPGLQLQKSGRDEARPDPVLEAGRLRALLGDEELQSYCAAASREDGPQDLAATLLNLKEELITAEFGIKRVRQGSLYQPMLSCAEDARHGRDALAQMAGGVARQIKKARNRLAHLS